MSRRAGYTLFGAAMRTTFVLQMRSVQELQAKALHFDGAGTTMEQQFAVMVGIGSAFVGLIVGYFIGYRSGQVAGELAALKSMQHRQGRESMSHRHRRTVDDNQDPAS